MPPESLQEPWQSFLAEVDGSLNETVEFHCLVQACRDDALWPGASDCGR